MDGYEDWEFWVNIVELGYEVKQIEKVLYLWRSHSGNETHNSKRRRYTLLLKIWRLHPRFFAPLVYNIFGEESAKTFLRLKLPFIIFKEALIRVVYLCFYRHFKKIIRALKDSKRPSTICF